MQQGFCIMQGIFYCFSLLILLGILNIFLLMINMCLSCNYFIHLEEKPMKTLLPSPIITRFYFHERCPCFRFKKRISTLDMARLNKYADSRLAPSPGSYVGPSTCNSFTTSLGFGQKVVAYSFFDPPTNQSR